MADDKRGIIYCFEHPLMAGIVKIGRTNDLERRLRDLYSTNIPMPFECVLALEVDDARESESLLHAVFDAQRVVRNREFFQVNSEAVIAAMTLTGGTDVTPDDGVVMVDEDERQAAAKKRSYFRFDDAGIPVGATLTYVDDQSITARVIKPGGLLKAVEFEGEPRSLSEAANIVQGRRNERVGVAGTWYWCYEGEMLDARRKRMESAGTYGVRLAPAPPSPIPPVEFPHAVDKEV